MPNKNFFVAIIVVIVMLILSGSIFVIDEGERALKLRFSKVARDADNMPTVYEPGIHFKFPYIESVIKLDARTQTMDGQPDVFTTENKEFLDVDTYAQWRINDFSQFYLKTNGDFKEAEGRLERFIDNGLRNQFGQRTLEEAISEQRDDLMDDIKGFVNPRVKEYGIELVDLRVKKVNYTSRVLADVYNQIISERKAKAIAIRSEGQQKANIIRSETDADVKQTLAEADEYARTRRGEADAEVAEMYANTYNKNRDFYAFLRSLDAYKESFKSKDDVLVIKPDSEFFKYFKDAEGKN